MYLGQVSGQENPGVGEGYLARALAKTTGVVIEGKCADHETHI